MTVSKRVESEPGSILVIMDGLAVESGMADSWLNAGRGGGSVGLGGGDSGELLGMGGATSRDDELAGVRFGSDGLTREKWLVLNVVAGFQF